MNADKFSKPTRNSIILRLPGIKNWAQILFYGLCGLFLARWLYSNGTAVQAAWQNLNWAWLLVSFLVLCLGFLFLPWGMVLFIRVGQQKFSYLDSAQAYYGSQMAKYLPGGIWIFPSRLIIMQKLGLNIKLSMMALAFEMMALVASGLLVSMLMLGATISRVWGVEFQALMILGCTADFLTFTWLPEIFHAAQNLSARLLGQTNSAPELPQTLQLIKAVSVAARFKIMLVSVALYSVMWLLAGLSFFVLAGSVSSTVTLQTLPYIVGVFVFAWLVGFITIFSPGGIGVREGVILLLLGPLMVAPYPVVTALISRILWSLAEVLFLVAALVIAKVR